MTFDHLQRLYFIGIGGIGMSALARFFHGRGKAVSGYDRTETVLTRALVNEGIPVHYDDDPAAIPAGVDLLVWTPAVPADHQELSWFRQSGIPMMKRAQVLGLISRNLRTVAVAGTHGKTTTSTMVAHLLRSGGIDATAFLGGISLNLGNNFVEGQSDWVVTEADEYDRSFHHLYPEIAILNSIDPDHLDIYGTPEAVVEAYEQFARQIKPGGALICRHGLPLDALTDELRSSGRNVYTFGIEEGDFQARNLRVEEGRMVFEFGADFAKDLDKINAATSGNPSPSGEGSGHEIRSAPLPGGGGVGGGVERGVGVNKADELHSDITAATTLTLRYPGRHNILNATAASAAALLAGVSLSDLPAALDSFAGVHRRFEYIVRRPELVYVDDYAHHPAELEATIAAARMLFPGKRITGVFQPHLFTRTRDFADGFARALDGLDECLLLPIYPAREEPIPGVTSGTILDKMTLGHKALVEKKDLLNVLKDKDLQVLLTMGAGDIDQLVEPIKTLFTD